MSNNFPTVSEKSYVRFANVLNKAIFDLDLQESRVILIAMSKIRWDQFSYENPIPVTVDDLVCLGIDRGNAYRYLSKVSESLIKKQFTVLGTNKYGLRDRTRYNWIVEDRNCPDLNQIEIYFSPYVMNFLNELSEYTGFRLFDIAGMPSFYVLRLYILLMQYKSTGWMKISVKELRTILEVPESQYPRFTNFKQKILDPAVRMINNLEGNTGKRIYCDCSSDGCKVGRKVENIFFNIEDTPIERAHVQSLPYDAVKLSRNLRFRSNLASVLSGREFEVEGGDFSKFNPMRFISYLKAQTIYKLPDGALSDDRILQRWLKTMLNRQDFIEFIQPFLEQIDLPEKPPKKRIR